MTPSPLLLACLLLPLALAGCGQSSEEKAEQMVREAVKGIGEGLETEVFVHRKDSPQLSPFLKEKFVPFSFAYPKTWAFEEGGGGKLAKGSNFVKLGREAAPGVTGEDLAVGWVVSPAGTSGEAFAKEQIAALKPRFAQGYPGYQVVGDERTTIGGKPAWGWRFSSHVTAEQTGSRDVDVWGVLLLVPNVVENRGVAVIYQGSSWSGVLTSAADLGVKGELPVLLRSFRFGE